MTISIVYGVHTVDLAFMTVEIQPLFIVNSVTFVLSTSPNYSILWQFIQKISTAFFSQTGF